MCTMAKKMRLREAHFLSANNAFPGVNLTLYCRQLLKRTFGFEVVASLKKSWSVREGFIIRNRGHCCICYRWVTVAERLICFLIARFNCEVN